MTTKKSSELTLKDRLSRLKYEDACKLLGAKGEALIRIGGAYDIDISHQVSLDENAFRLRLESAEAAIQLHDGAKKRLQMECSSCLGSCEHLGAAFSLILEEKMALGLSTFRPETAPLGTMSDEEVEAQALHAREKRASEEKMVVQSSDPKTLWTDYIVTNSGSGRSYRVALRGWERGESYCSCPDFRKNTLGTCKHILRTCRVVKKRFPAAVQKKPYVRQSFGVHLAYGRTTEVRLLVPHRISDEESKATKPFEGRQIENCHELLRCIERLEALGREVTVYPDAREYIEQRLMLQRLERKTMAMRSDPENHPLRQSLLKVDLLPHQLEGIAFAAKAGRAILADDMGLGKTIQGIGLAELLARETGIERVLVICPASLKAQWRSEIERFSERSVQLVVGTAAERSTQYGGGAFFTVCNYEQVLRDIMPIEETPWDLIILDEAQRIKNWEAKTSQIVKRLRSPFALALSGTPLENRLDDLFSISEFINEQRLGPAFRFFNRHRIVDEKGKVLGYRDISDVRRRLEPVLLRRTRASVIDDLPSRTTEIVRITPTDEQLEWHGEQMRALSLILRKNYLTEMDILRLRKILLSCRMVANSTFLVTKQTPAYSSKLARLEELLGDLAAEEDRKIILFSEWTTMLDMIEPLLAKAGLKYVRLDGSVPQKKRQKLVHQFFEDDKCRAFITTNAGSTGLNLQAANTVINVDLPWNPAVLEQRISRAHRMGQQSHVQVYVLITEGTIEENLLTTLSAKHQLALAALDPDSEIDEVVVESGMEELKRRLELLLGAKPEAPEDQSQQQRTIELIDAEKRDRIALAGGQLLSAAFSLLREIVPETERSRASSELTSQFKQGLESCLVEDDEGRCRLTLTLPDRETIDDLASTFSLLACQGGQKAS